MTDDDGGLRFGIIVRQSRSTGSSAIVNRKDRKNGGEQQNDRKFRIYKGL